MLHLITKESSVQMNLGVVCNMVKHKKNKQTNFLKICIGEI